jgi:hypothetical protein
MNLFAIFQKTMLRLILPSSSALKLLAEIAAVYILL